MNSAQSYDEITYLQLDEYKNKVKETISLALQKTDSIIFANIAREAGVNEFVIRKYPALRTFILNEILQVKKKHVINCRIEKVVNNLISKNQNITYVTVINKCKFSNEFNEEREFINSRIRELIALNSTTFKV